MKMTALKPLFDATAKNDKTAMLTEIKILLSRDDCGPAWTENFNKLYGFIYSGIPAFTINMPGGNSKLPFVAFSALPGASFCPGAGPCLMHCYSFKAHRYPAALCRQIQNTILLNSASGREFIERDISELLNKEGRFQKAIKAGIKIDFRLYVDGDFRHLADMNFWMGFLKTDIGQKLAVYGYSKSFLVFLDYARSGYIFPDNYLLNISSGHGYDQETENKVMALDCVRGHFKTVKMDYKVTSDMHSNRDHQKALRKAYGKKAFTCPGACGTCTTKGHACGSKRFNNIDIIIAVH